MQNELPMHTIVRIGYLLLGGWLFLFGLAGYIGRDHPVFAWVLHPGAMIVGIIFLLSLFAISKSELAGMIILSVFLLGMGVIPFESVFRLEPGNLVGIILWGISLLAGCLIPLGLAEKGWGDRLGLALLSVWLIIWPLPIVANEPCIGLMIDALLPALAGCIILIGSLLVLLRARREMP
jgi:hypothetical protein